MAVQRYSRLEMQAIISNILKEDVTILPIGNHELRRHLVYRVETKKVPLFLNIITKIFMAVVKYPL